MSETPASLRRKIASAGDLEAVVRTMKAMAASSIGQYENAVRSLDDYNRTVALGLIACFRQGQAGIGPADKKAQAAIGAVVFGSDQGLVGQFNETLSEFVVGALAKLPGQKVIWVIGERMQARLEDSGLNPGKGFALPSSINAITPLVGQLLIDIESRRLSEGIDQIYLYHNRPRTGSLYEPVAQLLLPLDTVWQKRLAVTPWPSNKLPEVMHCGEPTLLAFVREYLFVSLFRACAESLASENASRLAAMQRAEKNIGELLDTLGSEFHRLRQSAIDEELSDVISGFKTLSDQR